MWKMFIICTYFSIYMRHYLKQTFHDTCPVEKASITTPRWKGWRYFATIIILWSPRIAKFLQILLAWVDRCWYKKKILYLTHHNFPTLAPGIWLYFRADNTFVHPRYVMNFNRSNLEDKFVKLVIFFIKYLPVCKFLQIIYFRIGKDQNNSIQFKLNGDLLKISKWNFLWIGPTHVSWPSLFCLSFKKDFKMKFSLNRSHPCLLTFTILSHSVAVPQKWGQAFLVKHKTANVKRLNSKSWNKFREDNRVQI
jgi:hypothetical protein